MFSGKQGAIADITTFWRRALWRFGLPTLLPRVYEASAAAAAGSIRRVPLE